MPTTKKVFPVFAVFEDKLLDEERLLPLDELPLLLMLPLLLVTPDPEDVVVVGLLVVVPEVGSLDEEV